MRYNGFGYAVRKGLKDFDNDYVAIMMAYLSVSPDDLVRFYNKMGEGFDYVLGRIYLRSIRFS